MARVGLKAMGFIHPVPNLEIYLSLDWTLNLISTILECQKLFLKCII